MLLFWVFCFAAQAERPTVVSLDYCADQFVLGLADREQMLAVSSDADKPFSHLNALAKGVPMVRSSAEDVIALNPDIVVRSWGGDARALEFYERIGIETVQVGYASDVAGAIQVTRDIAARLGRSDRADELIRHMEDTPTSAEAVYLTPGGVTAGRGTMVDSIMAEAGIQNRVDQSGWSSLPLEALVLDPPVFALTAFFGFDTDETDRWSLSRHPVMQKLLENSKVIQLDESRLACPAWFVQDEVANIRRQVRDAE